MRAFWADTPAVVWSAIIVFLFLMSQWLTEFFGAVTWVKVLVGFLVIVAIPTLRLIGQGETPAGRAVGEVMVTRSKISRWLW